MRVELRALSWGTLALPLIYLFGRISDASIRYVLQWSALVALVAYLASDVLIPKLQDYLLKRGLKGKDMGRKGTKDEDKDMYVCYSFALHKILMDD